MRGKTALIVAAVVLLVLAIGVLFPAVTVKPKPPTDLPWQVQVDPAGRTQVFGVTLGQTRLNEAEQRFGESEVTLFRAPQGSIAVEGFFDNINLSGLDAKIVVGLRVPSGEVQAMYDNGIRSAKLGSGAQKVMLASTDRQRVGEAPIDAITYMPAIQLDPQLVAKRFGEPAEKWKERDTGVIHWLYPKIGLDVAFGKKEKEVLQYVLPAEFARLRDPLTSGERVP